MFFGHPTVCFMGLGVILEVFCGFDVFFADEHCTSQPYGPMVLSFVQA